MLGDRGPDRAKVIGLEILGRRDISMQTVHAHRSKFGDQQRLVRKGGQLPSQMLFGRPPRPRFELVAMLDQRIRQRAVVHVGRHEVGFFKSPVLADRTRGRHEGDKPRRVELFRSADQRRA